MTVITRSQSRQMVEPIATQQQPIEPPVAITRVLDLVYITDVILPLATDPPQTMSAYHMATSSNFKTQVKFYLVILNDKGRNYFENVDIAVSLFRIINLYIKQIYCSNPSEWYKFIITLYNKANELLTDLRENEIPVRTDRECQSVTNLAYELIEAINKSELILNRNNYFSSV